VVVAWRLGIVSDVLAVALAVVGQQVRDTRQHAVCCVNPSGLPTNQPHVASGVLNVAVLLVDALGVEVAGIESQRLRRSMQ
jgi:hypothetical protein